MSARVSGVLVLDKPRGPTSHDVVARVRKALRTREVGHAGTLDPMATGVLVVAVGEATKLVPWLSASDKEYEATVALGIETDSLDADGRETRRVAPSAALRAALAQSSARLAGPARAGTEERMLAKRSGGPHVAPAIRDAIEGERARTSQVPPAFSAVQKDGERAYARARRGEEVTLEPRPVQVRRLELVGCGEEPPFVAVSLQVAKGYYVRALARDLAQALGTVGHLTALRRTRSGCFVLGEALPLDTPADELAARIEPLDRAAARALPAAELTEAGVRDATHGRRVRSEDIVLVRGDDAPSPGPCAWLDARGRLVAVGEVDAAGVGKVLRGFGGGSGRGGMAVS